ncbi:GGDEF domain-containing protein [Streptomyces sp. Ag109_O5-10]|uniref:GGDEF domain-containing protein n=1 Tax=Streptomyces sp. Ag109_O5-10 TaxID=1855349 RepID=UPI00089572B4|nr:GGDEF domain-containing protein [Streptomyces sp. Ag109_O5-10]SEF19010.1 diguanylate cyclase (GGDEF) domain-containing protein [Streptomyces sp. Ag109_O5-10]
MTPALRVHARIGHRALLVTAAALPLTGWTVHAYTLHRQLAASRRDPLTGLLRRDTYTARAHRILARHGGTAVVVLVDVDHFKAVNDTFGHAAGDAVLAATADRLTAWAGPHASAGRLGGDEFAVVLQLDVAARGRRFEQLLRVLHTPVVLDDGRTVDVAVSVGAAAPDAIGTRDLSALQRAADAALYAGKHSGRVTFAGPEHTAVPAVNGRRAGRPGTATWGRAA